MGYKKKNKLAFHCHTHILGSLSRPARDRGSAEKKNSRGPEVVFIKARKKPLETTPSPYSTRLRKELKPRPVFNTY